MNYTIEKLTTLIGARRYGDSDASIGFILTDSRSLCFPEETLFFALKSDRNDGQNFTVAEYATSWYQRFLWVGRQIILRRTS